MHGDFVKIGEPPRAVAIRGETIRLGQLLKLAAVAASGGEVKVLLGEAVLVNGVREARRGRQLRAGDLVEVAGERLLVERASP